MTIASEMGKVRTLIDDTILAVENAQKTLAQTEHLTEERGTNGKKTASRLEGSLKTLRRRRKELGGY